MQNITLKNEYERLFNKIADIKESLCSADSLEALAYVDKKLLNRLLNNAKIKNINILIGKVSLNGEADLSSQVYLTKIFFEEQIDSEYCLYGEYTIQHRLLDKPYLPNFLPESFQFVIDRIDRLNSKHTDRALFASNRIEGPFNGKLYDYSSYITEQAMKKWRDMSYKGE